MARKNSILISTIALGLMSFAAGAIAQKVVSGGSTLAQGLYIAIMPADNFNFSYKVTGSEVGKTAVLTNEGALFDRPARSVAIAGSDVVISPTEDAVYKANHIDDKDNKWGPVLQFPAVVTSVVIPFRKALAVGTPLNTSTQLDFSAEISPTAPDVADLCRIFSGAVTDWSGIEGSHRTGPITVLYREDGSGTSALLGNFLRTQCPTELYATTNLKAANNVGRGVFQLDQQNFSQQFKNDKVPPTFMQVKYSAGMRDAVFAAEGRIGYMGPDLILPADLSNAAKYAKVRGFSPTSANVNAAVMAWVPTTPTNATAVTRDAWVPKFGLHPGGYPIVGFTALVVNQCYSGADANGTQAAIVAFLTRLYTTTDFDAAITADNFVPLPSSWKTAVTNTFLNNTSGRGQNIGNATVCNGIGKPLL
ncbi:PstS family phosphate ABC transporter substrate-binding protein [Bordetella genomosp. 13]|uniref:PstS family phosphate ABC transporter substrate-binding protein n=1 Tax=Bordetella genomosp. 13 TaxID=463040 RepID=UPI0011A2FD78|nr:substrate-binding domain-containing protein [Bordetella genomosp. 13]